MHGSARAHHEHGSAGNEQSLALDQEPNPPQGGPQILRLWQVSVIQCALGSMAKGVSTAPGRRAGSLCDHIRLVTVCLHTCICFKLAAALTFRSHHAFQRARRFQAGIWVSGSDGGEPSAGMLSMLMAAAEDAATVKPFLRARRACCWSPCRGTACRLCSLDLSRGVSSTRPPCLADGGVRGALWGAGSLW